MEWSITTLLGGRPELQDERIVETYRALAEAPRGSAEYAALFRRLHIEAHFLLIALGHILRSLETCAEVLGDERITAIRDDFDERAPWIKHFRNVLEHLDKYTQGEGRLQGPGKPLDSRVGPVLVFDPRAPPWEAIVQLGSWRLPLRAAAEAGSALGHELAEAWETRFGSDEPQVLSGRSR